MILILGRNGQLAQSLAELEWSESVQILGSNELDFANPTFIKNALDRLVTELPRLIFNAAAYTAVDKAETEKDLAFLVNATAVEALALWAKEKGSTLVHFSTDYVYPGTGETAMSETDTLGPQNVYGESKLQGEERLLASGVRSYIFRISWVVSPFGNNFVKTMLRLGRERKELKIVADQIGSPMSSLAIARLMHRYFSLNMHKTLNPGVYNLSAAPFVSWYDFAVEIFAQAKTLGYQGAVETVIPIPTEAFPTPAKRPKNSRMNDHKLHQQMNDGLGDWRVDLNEILRRLL